LPQDTGRQIPPEALREAEGRQFLRMVDGHCAQLTRTGDGRLICAIYDQRPEACRAFRAGSFECGRTRHHRLPLAEALRQPSLPTNALGLLIEKGPGADLPPAHLLGPVSKARPKPPA
jgi:uncharacterized protein